MVKKKSINSVISTHCVLTIEAHILSKRLRQENVVTLINEVSYSPCISINITTGKALIGHVKKHQKFPLLQREWTTQEQSIKTSDLI